MRVTLQETTRLNFAADSLAGLSVGDSLGAQYFAPGRTVGVIPPPVWEWTDDTEMARSIVWMLHEAGRIDPDRLAVAFAERCEPYADDPSYPLMVQKITDLDVPAQIESQLRRAWRSLTEATPGIKGPQRLEVVLMLGDPGDDYLMRVAGGYYGMGGATPGLLYLLAWPTDEVIGRIAHCAVHEFHHQVRYSNVEWDPVRVTVGEHIVAEGLAEAFVRELSGPQAMGPWSGRVTGEAFEQAYAKTMAHIDLPGMHNTPAFVLGDTAAARFGGQPRGIPDMAGYGAGLRIIDRFLAATGLSVAASSTLPSSEILAHSVG